MLMMLLTIIASSLSSSDSLQTKQRSSMLGVLKHQQGGPYADGPDYHPPVLDCR